MSIFRKKKMSAAEEFQANYNQLKYSLEEVTLSQLAEIRAKEPRFPEYPGYVVIQSIKYMLGEDLYAILREAHDPETMRNLLDMIPDLAKDIFCTDKLLAELNAIMNYKKESMTRLHGKEWIKSDEGKRLEERFTLIPDNIKKMGIILDETLTFNH